MSAPPNQQPLPPHPPLTHQNDTTEPPLHQRSLPNHGEGDGAEVGSLVEHGLSDAGVSHSRADSDMDIEDEIAHIDEAKISEPVDGLNQNSVMIPNELEMKELLPVLQNVAERSPSQDSISRNILDSGPSEFLEQIKGDNPFPDCDHFCFGGSLTGVDTSVMNQIGALNNAEGYVDQFSTCPNVALSQPKPSVSSQPENVYGQLNPVESQNVSSQPVRGASPFRLLQDSTSDDGSQSVLEPSPEKVGIVSVRPSVKSVAVHLDGEMSYHIRTDGTAKNVDRASTVKTEQPEDNNTYGIKKSTNTGTSEMDFQAKVHKGGGVSSASRSSKYQKDDEKHVPSQHKVDEFGRLVRERASDSDSEELQDSRMRGKRGQSRTRSRSPHDRRRRSPVRRRERRSRSRSRSPKKRRSRSRSPLRRGDEYGIDKTRRDKGQHRQYCMDYKRGKCYRGSSCRYMHDSNRGDDSSRSYRSKYQEVPPSPRKNVEKPDHKHYDKKESLISEINVSDKDVESLITSVAESVRTREEASQSQETKSNKKELVADAGGKLSPADISVVQQSQANLFYPKSLDQLQPSHIDGPSASDSTPLQASEAIQNPHQHIGIADLYPNNPHQQSQLPPPPLPRAPPRPPIAQPANPPFYPYQAPLTHQHTHLSGPPLNPPWNSLQPPSLQFQQNQTPSWNNNYPPHMLVNPYPTVQHNSHLQAGESHHGTHLPLQNPYRSFPQTEHTGPSMFPVSTMTQPHVGPNSSSAQSHMHMPSYGLQQPTAGSVSNYQNPFASPFEQPESSKISSNDFNQTDSMKYDPISDSIDNGQKLDGSNMPQDLLIERTKPREFGAVALSTLENDEYGETAEPEVGAVENGSPSDPIDEALEIDQVKSPGKSNKEGKDSRSMKLFKVALADFVKEVLKPSWRQGNMSKEAFKTIVKKTVDKVAGAMKSHQVPKSQAKINQYIDSSQRKLTKLVMGYVEKYVKV